MRNLLIILVLALLFSCEADQLNMEALGANTGIVGTWVRDEYQGDTLFLDRSGAFVADKYGFTLHDDGTFTEHKTSSLDLNSPQAYRSYEGTWEAVSDSLLDITVAYWGGVMTYQIRILSLTADQLAIRYLYSDSRTDSR